MQRKCCDIKKKPDKPLNILLLKNSQDRCLNSLIWWKNKCLWALWANPHKCIALPSRNLRLENQQRSLSHSSVLHRTVCCSRDKWSLGITCVVTCGVDSNTIQLFYEEQAIILFGAGTPGLLKRWFWWKKYDYNSLVFRSSTADCLVFRSTTSDPTRSWRRSWLVCIYLIWSVQR